MAITKKEALSVIFRCAQKYKSELMNHSLLFICMDKHKHTYAVEVTFDASNFQHLTGLETHKKQSKPFVYLNPAVCKSYLSLKM